jgi:hypothetical protein
MGDSAENHAIQPLNLWIKDGQMHRRRDRNGSSGPSCNLNWSCTGPKSISFAVSRLKGAGQGKKETVPTWRDQTPGAWN